MTNIEAKFNKGQQHLNGLNGRVAEEIAATPEGEEWAGYAVVRLLGKEVVRAFGSETRTPVVLITQIEVVEEANAEVVAQMMRTVFERRTAEGTLFDPANRDDPPDPDLARRRAAVKDLYEDPGDGLTPDERHDRAVGAIFGGNPVQGELSDDLHNGPVVDRLPNGTPVTEPAPGIFVVGGLEPGQTSGDPHQRSLRDAVSRASARARAAKAWSPADDIGGAS